MLRNQLAFGLASMALVTACSTNYMPRGPGVSVTMQGGVQTYVRDGQSYPHGFLGSGLIRAVRGVPAAEEAAREYRGRLRDGLLVMLVGTVCVATATAFMARNLGPDDTDPPTTELLVMGACTIGMLGGAGYTATAEPYRWDAINIFNDARTAPLPPPTFVPYGAPGAARPPAKSTMSLGMR